MQSVIWKMEDNFKTKAKGSVGATPKEMVRTENTWDHTPLSVCRPEFAAAVWKGRCTRATSPPVAAAHAGHLPPSRRALETRSRFLPSRPPSSWLNR